jgi:exosortase family protein XrtF
MKEYFQQPFIRFLLYFAGLYLGWFLLYDSWLHPQGGLDHIVNYYTIWVAEDLLEWLGYTINVSGQVIAIEGTSGVFVGDSCNSITLVALYTGFLIAFPGNIKSKLYFIGIGTLVIWILNIIRIAALAMLDTISREWTEFNHTYTFSLVMYGVIFLTWYIWLNKYANVRPKKSKEENHSQTIQTSTK